mmetsp:Transcript_48036/g.112211  ORF Transcript_48036/g.112211 Transcript_48036/m.112211 type:complete len:979 (-) Transcript_48036:90-3026(-)
MRTLLDSSPHDQLRKSRVVTDEWKQLVQSVCTRGLAFGPVNSALEQCCTWVILLVDFARDLLLEYERRSPSLSDAAALLRDAEESLLMKADEKAAEIEARRAVEILDGLQQSKIATSPLPPTPKSAARGNSPESDWESLDDLNDQPCAEDLWILGTRLVFHAERLNIEALVMQGSEEGNIILAVKKPLAELMTLLATCPSAKSKAAIHLALSELYVSEAGCIPQRSEKDQALELAKKHLEQAEEGLRAISRRRVADIVELLLVRCMVVHGVILYMEKQVDAVMEVVTDIQIRTRSKMGKISLEREDTYTWRVYKCAARLLELGCLVVTTRRQKILEDQDVFLAEFELLDDKVLLDSVCCAFGEALLRVGAVSEAIEVSRDALSSLHSESTSWRRFLRKATVTHNLAMAYIAKEDASKAVRLAREGLQNSNARENILLKLTLMQAFASRDQVPKALAMESEVLRACGPQGVSDRRWEAQANMTIGMLRIDARDITKKPIKHIEEAVRLWQELGEEGKAYETYFLLVDAWLEMDTKHAAKLSEAQAAYWFGHGERAFEGRALLQLATAQAGSHDLLDAMASSMDAKVAFKAARDSIGQVAALTVTCYLNKALGDMDESLKAAREAQEVVDENGDMSHIMFSKNMCLLARLYLENGLLSQSMETCSKAWGSLSLSSNLGKFEILLLRVQGYIAKARTNHALSTSSAVSNEDSVLLDVNWMIELARRSFSQVHLTQALLLKGELLTLTGASGQALFCINSAHDIALRRYDGSSALRIELLLAECEEQCGLVSRALAHAKRAKNLAMSRGEHEYRKRAISVLQRLHSEEAAENFKLSDVLVPLENTAVNGVTNPSEQQNGFSYNVENVADKGETGASKLPLDGHVCASGYASRHEIEEMLQDVLASYSQDDSTVHFQSDSSLEESGIDSSMSIALHRALEVEIGVSLPPSFLVEYPTFRKLVDHIFAVVNDATLGEKLLPKVE